MVKPLTLPEQMKEIYFVPDYRLIVCVATSDYSAVWKRDKNGKIVQALPDLRFSKYNNHVMRMAFEKYDFKDMGPGDIYFIDEEPSVDDKDQVIRSIKKRLD